MGTDEVRFLVAPSVALVEASGLARFEWEPGLGYLSHRDRFAVTEECSGLRFLAVSFALLAWIWGRRAAGSAALGRALVLAAAGAWAATTVANAVRIGGAIWLRRLDWRGAAWSFDEAHQLESVLVYLVALAALVAAAGAVGRRANAPETA